MEEDAKPTAWKMLFALDQQAAKVTQVLEMAMQGRSFKDPRPAELLKCLSLRFRTAPEEWMADALPSVIHEAKECGCWVDASPSDIAATAGEERVLLWGLASSCKAIESLMKAYLHEQRGEKISAQNRIGIAMLCAGEVSALWGTEPLYMRGGRATAEKNEARQQLPHVFKLWLEYKESGYCKSLYKNRNAFDRYCEDSFGPTQLTIQKWRTAWERGGAKTLADAMKLTNAEQRKSKRKPEPAS